MPARINNREVDAIRELLQLNDTPLLPTANNKSAWSVPRTRHYRDKFVVHLDSDLTMHLPRLDYAQRAGYFYYDHIATTELASSDHGEKAGALRKYYSFTYTEAEEALEHAARRA